MISSTAISVSRRERKEAKKGEFAIIMLCCCCAKSSIQVRKTETKMTDRYGCVCVFVIRSVPAVWSRAR
jgi:hypothetical protein